MSTPQRKWNNLDDRRAAYVAVLTKILSDDEFRRSCLVSDEYARQAFIEIGGIDVPCDVKIVFVPEGDRDNAVNNQSGSAVIEIPPAGTDPASKEAATYFRCTYVLWLEK